MALSPLVLAIIERTKTDVISFHGQGLWDDDIKELVEVLNTKPEFTELDLSCNNFRFRQSNPLSDLRYIRVLDVSSNSVKPKTLHELLANESIEEIDLSQNGFDDSVTEVIIQNTQQLRLKLGGNNSLSSESLDAISQQLEKNQRDRKSVVQPCPTRCSR